MLLNKFKNYATAFCASMVICFGVQNFACAQNPISSEKPDYTITSAQEVVQEFNKDPKAAKSKYIGKVIRIKDKLSTVIPDLSKSGNRQLIASYWYPNFNDMDGRHIGLYVTFIRGLYPVDEKLREPRTGDTVQFKGKVGFIELSGNQPFITVKFKIEDAEIESIEK